GHNHRRRRRPPAVRREFEKAVRVATKRHKRHKEEFSFTGSKNTDFFLCFLYLFVAVRREFEKAVRVATKAQKTQRRILFTGSKNTRFLFVFFVPFCGSFP
ncbi:MAG TPA: hypothetical protein VHH35_10295, partial [Pyrinomonadaceae bacterium]|nr:hypothetical protein [Pyrinomonadaceae bacterium]